MSIYTGVNNVARNVSSIYVGVNGTARKVLNGYVGVNGVARQFYASFTNPLNTDQLTLGQHNVFFTAHPSLRWCVDHLDRNYVYLGLYDASETTAFGSSNTYSGSTIAAKCTTFLNSVIPNVAQYLENVTVNGVTSKVFIPSYKMFSGTASYAGSADTNDPTFNWSYASNNNRKACVSSTSWSTIGNCFYLSSPNSGSGSGRVWGVSSYGGFTTIYGTAGSYGFRPEVKVKYKQ